LISQYGLEVDEGQIIGFAQET